MTYIELLTQIKDARIEYKTATTVEAKRKAYAKAAAASCELRNEYRVDCPALAPDA